MNPIAHPFPTITRIKYPKSHINHVQSQAIVPKNQTQNTSININKNLTSWAKWLKKNITSTIDQTNYHQIPVKILFMNASTLIITWVKSRIDSKSKKRKILCLKEEIDNWPDKINSLMSIFKLSKNAIEISRNTTKINNFSQNINKKTTLVITVKTIQNIATRITKAKTTNTAKHKAYTST